MESARIDLIPRAQDERRAADGSASNQACATAAPPAERRRQVTRRESKPLETHPRRSTISSARYTELRYPREHILFPPDPVAPHGMRVQHQDTLPVQLTAADGWLRPESRQASADDNGQNRRRHREDEENGRRPHPKRFLFCFPWIKSQRMRSQILTCFVSGIFFLVLLAIYLGLALTKNIHQSELIIMIVLVIITAAMFFSYSVVRLCLLIFRPDRELRRRSRRPDMLGPSGYAMPPKPIPVVLAQDEEAVGIQSEAGKSRPPAYGLWRESVRLDPNRLFWQRTDGTPSRPATRTGPRPPSYASEDGVSYVVEARPRSMAPPPHADVPVPASASASAYSPTPPPTGESYR